MRLKNTMGPGLLAFMIVLILGAMCGIASLVGHITTDPWIGVSGNGPIYVETEDGTLIFAEMDKFSVNGGYIFIERGWVWGAFVWELHEGAVVPLTEANFSYDYPK